MVLYLLKIKTKVDLIVASKLLICVDDIIYYMMNRLSHSIKVLRLLSEKTYNPLAWVTYILFSVVMKLFRLAKQQNKIRKIM